MVRERSLLEKIPNSEFKVEICDLTNIMATLRFEPKIIQQVKTLQQSDLKTLKIRD